MTIRITTFRHGGWDGWRWFNVSAPAWLITVGHRSCFIVLWNAFYRATTGGTFWGFGVVQIKRRHLLYVGHDAVSFCFLGKTR